MRQRPRPPAPLPALAALVLLGACTNPDIELAEAARGALLGTTKAELLSCAGVPHRSATAGGKEFLTYSLGGLESLPRTVSVPVEREDKRGRPVLRREQVTVNEVVETGCEATFTLAGGIVEGLVYGGRMSPHRCAAIVANCLAPR